MKIRLKDIHRDVLADQGQIALPGSHTLTLYTPSNPSDDIEVRMGTAEGQRMMDWYNAHKDKTIVAITTKKLDGSYLVSDTVTSKASLFNSRADALQALTTDGVDVGFMPLLSISAKVSGKKSPVEILPA